MFTLMGFGVYGIFFYILTVILLGLHNLYITSTAWRRKETSKKYVILAFFASIWTAVFLFSFFGSYKMYFMLFGGYLCALVYNVKTLDVSEDKGRFNKVILFYNIVGCSVVFLKMLSGAGIDFTGLGSGISHVVTLSHSLFQMVNFSFLQIFYPTLFIPPILLNQKKSKRMLGRLEPKIVKAIACYAVFFIGVLSIPAVIMISSFSHIPVCADDYQPTPLKFGAKVNSFANEAETMGDWEELFSKELQIAQELRLDYVDFYVDRSYLEDPSKNQRLQEGLIRVREEGFGIILACMGSPDWLFNPPSLAIHNEVMRNDALELATFHPDYLIVIVEPLARHNGMMLSEPVSVEEWVSTINETALQVKMIDENIKVAVSIAAAEREGLNLFYTLQDSNLDAIGIDVHPFHIDMADILYEYAQSHYTKELWVFEFGMETYNFGEETQARYMSYLPKIASDVHISGVVQYDIMDNPQSQLGLVYTSGERKLGFYAYKNAIERIRGNYFDFTGIVHEKQKDNWILVLILIVLGSYMILRRMRK